VNFGKLESDKVVIPLPPSKGDNSKFVNPIYLIVNYPIMSPFEGRVDSF
jgi:hypothetical protein